MSESPKRHPRDFEPHRRGDGLRLHVRQYNGGLYEVRGLLEDGYVHVCECISQEFADMIAAALEQTAAERTP
jgi:hypothetical protein